MNPVLSGGKTHILHLYTLDLAFVFILVDLAWKELYQIQKFGKQEKVTIQCSSILRQPPIGNLLFCNLLMATQDISLGCKEISALFFQQYILILYFRPLIPQSAGWQ